jgi:recombination protein RecA
MIATDNPLYKDLVKQFGDALHDASFITDRPKQIISVSPKIDIALGGGVPEGSLFIMTGPEKIGKTVTALSFCANAQAQDRYIYYGNIEGRLKKRDLEGIRELQLGPEKFQMVGSAEGNILSGEDYLAIFDKIAHGHSRSVAVIDSFSALAAEAELAGELKDIQVMSIQKTQAKWCRRIGNVLPINNVTVVGITHMMANVSSFGSRKTKTEKSGTSLKYQVDVKLEASHSEAVMQGESQIGQKIHWKVITSAIGPPGQKVESIIKYGRGVWREYEIADLCCDFGIATKKGAWITLSDTEKFQGMPNFAQYLEENQERCIGLEKEIFDTVGIAR